MLDEREYRSVQAANQFVSAANKETSDEETRSSEVLLDLGANLKGEILNALIANQNMIANSCTTSDEARLKMIKKNNRLVSKLMKLPVTVIDGEVEEADDVQPNGKFQVQETFNCEILILKIVLNLMLYSPSFK